MSKVKIKEETMADIADVIRAKLNTEQKYKPSEMAEAVFSIGTRTSIGGARIDEYFSSDSSISPSTFIEFENSYREDETECFSERFFAKAELNDDFFVVVYDDLSNLKISLCKFREQGVSMVSTINLASTMYGCLATVVALSEEKVLVIYYKNEDRPSLYGVVCGISLVGESITKGEETSIGITSNLFLSKSLCFLGEGRVFFSALSFDSLEAFGCVIEVSDMSFEIINRISISMSGDPLRPPIAEKITSTSDSTSIIILFSTSTGAWASTISINSEGFPVQGTNVSVNPNQATFSGSNLDIIYIGEYDSKEYSLILYDEITYVSAEESYGTIYGCICISNNSSLTIGASVQLSNENTYFPLTQSFQGFLLLKGGEYEAQIGYISASNTIRLSRVKITNNDSSAGETLSVVLELVEDISLDEEPPNQFSQIEAGGIDDKKGFLFYMAAPSNLRMIGVECKVKPSNTKIDGLTRTECASSTKGEVFVLLNNQARL